VRADRTAFAAALAGVTTTGAEQEIEVTIAGRRRNDRRHCNVRLRPLHSANETISGAVVCVEDVTERVRARAELEHRATYDELTQCLNRSSILSKLDDVARARRSVGVIFVDVDDFKRVNDEFGHAAGDAVLVEVARRLRNGIRRDDHVGRVGGDEFLVVCDGIGDATDVNVIADRIRTHLGAPISIEDRELKVDASVGVAAAAPGWQPEALVANADAAMYENKRGRQRRR
jgi:diguanylate cyclase (GGDEF)-like protein